jgi:hypothetical protein
MKTVVEETMKQYWKMKYDGEGQPAEVFLIAKYEALGQAVKKCLDIAGSHRFEWGDRAITAFNEIELALYPQLKELSEKGDGAEDVPQNICCAS